MAEKHGIYKVELNKLDKHNVRDDSDVDINALGQAIDTTFGRSSTPNTATFSVKMSLGNGPTLIVKYAAIINFGNERKMIDLKRRYTAESQAAIDAVLKSVKSTYKEIADSSLTLKELNTVDSLEIIGTAIFTPRKQAYFRRETLYSVE